MKQLPEKLWRGLRRFTFPDNRHDGPHYADNDNICLAAARELLCCNLARCQLREEAGRLAGTRGSYSGSGCEVESWRITAAIVFTFHACWNRCAPHLVVLLMYRPIVPPCQNRLCCCKQKSNRFAQIQIALIQAQSVIALKKYRFFSHFIFPFFFFVNRLLKY